MPTAREVAERVQGRLGGGVALVTGSGSTDDDETGIGAAIAAALAFAVARVVVLDRDSAAADRSVGLIEAHGGRAAGFVGDVREAADCDAAARFAVSRFGSLEVLVNNAATLGRATTLEFEDSDLEETLDINLMGPIRMARACVPVMRTGSSIVNITSLGAIRSFGRIDYEASKGGLISLTNTLAIQLGPKGIRVNVVCPGQVWTPLGKRRLVEMGQTEEDLEASRKARAAAVPLQSEGTAWDIALAVLFLVSDDARWISGHSLVVDGGQSGVVGSVEP